MRVPVEQRDGSSDVVASSSVPSKTRRLAPALAFAQVYRRLLRRRPPSSRKINIVAQYPPSLVHRSQSQLHRGLRVQVDVVVQHFAHPRHPLELLPFALLLLVRLNERGSDGFASLSHAFHHLR
ncbi:hypothetical protein GALMADRAFT_1140726 [Galerina marginata CBS 339.88]|uniref:Uncharacterized protein n=1 Tax=Galerina marginata (strain CBS 339.88) TaxID=685588 RepID=A0A067S7F6_GALM3|nr:hypothetical protein GALMADRAFT_1140726 [Galerina marginata CBS 339.88]